MIVVNSICIITRFMGGNALTAGLAPGVLGTVATRTDYVFCGSARAGRAISTRAITAAVTSYSNG